MSKHCVQCSNCFYIICFECISDDSIKPRCTCGEIYRTEWTDVVSKRRKPRTRQKAVNPGSYNSSNSPVSVSSDLEAGRDAEQTTDSDQSIDVDKLQSALQTSSAPSSVRSAPPKPPAPIKSKRCQKKIQLTNDDCESIKGGVIEKDRQNHTRI